MGLVLFYFNNTNYILQCLRLLFYPSWSKYLYRILYQSCPKYDIYARHFEIKMFLKTLKGKRLCPVCKIKIIKLHYKPEQTNLKRIRLSVDLV